MLENIKLSKRIYDAKPSYKPQLLSPSYPNVASKKASGKLKMLSQTVVFPSLEKPRIIMPMPESLKLKMKGDNNFLRQECRIKQKMRSKQYLKYIGKKSVKRIAQHKNNLIKSKSVFDDKKHHNKHMKSESSSDKESSCEVNKDHILLQKRRNTLRSMTLAQRAKQPEFTLEDKSHGIVLEVINNVNYRWIYMTHAISRSDGRKHSLALKAWSLKDVKETLKRHFATILRSIQGVNL